MTQNQFLKQLYRRLKWQMSPQDAQDVVRDYREYFGEEKRAGKGETEICVSLGSPQNIVKNLADERGHSIRPRQYWLTLILMVVVVGFYPALTSFWGLYSEFFPYLFIIKYLYVLAAPVPVVLFCRLRQSPDSTANKTRNYLLIGLAVAALIVSVYSSISVNHFLQQFNTPPQYNYDASEVSVIYRISITPIWVIAVIWGYSIIRLFPKVGMRFWWINYLYSALLPSLAHCFDVLCDMNYDEAGFPNYTEVIFGPVAIMLLLGIVCAVGSCLQMETARWIVN